MKKEIKSPATDSVGLSRLIVSFYSPGDGIDRNAKQLFESFLSSDFPQIQYSIKNWGREGETDYCFELLDLSDDKQIHFISSVKKNLENCEKVRFYENQACKK